MTLGEVEKIAPSAIWRLDISSHSTRSGFSHSLGRKPSEHMRKLLKAAGIHQKRRKVPHSLRSNFHQALDKTLLAPDLQKRLLGHSTDSVKISNYNETDQGPALPAAEVLPYLARVAFAITVPSWLEAVGTRDQRTEK